MTIQHYARVNVGLAQYAPAWLQRQASIDKLIDIIHAAAKRDVQILCTSEAWLPGYPFWLSFTHASRFDASEQKLLHAHYLSQAVCIEAGDLQPICAALAEHAMCLVLGIMERPRNRGGHSLYASRVCINADGSIASVHRKLVPTYEERLAWGAGDGHGLCVHDWCGFTVSALNCWENWMPLARSALYAQGSNLHFALWPGSAANTTDVSRFIALEGRQFVVSVGAPMRSEDIHDALPLADMLREQAPTVLANGGSCVAGPDGNWLLPPQTEGEGLFVLELDQQRVLEERQNLDVSGHYARPDVFSLQLNRQRQQLLTDREE